MSDRPVTAPPVAAFAPLKVARYRRLWSASIVSHVGTFLHMTAGPWLMHEMTGSPLMVGLVTTALLLPRLLFTLPAGALADAMDRRAIIMTGQIVSAVPVAGLAVMAYTDRLDPTWLLLLTFFIGIGSAITLPSFQTLVPDLVPREMLAQAVTLNAAAFNLARALGPSLGGALVAVGLTHAAFGANALSYLVVAGVVMTFPSAPAERAGRRRLVRSTALGMRYVRFTRSIRILMVISACFQLGASSVQALLPSLAATELGLTAAGFGLLYGCFGAGALVGAASRERARFRAGDKMLPGSILMFGSTGIAVGLAPTPALAGAALAVSGMTLIWTITTLNASVQTLAPRWVRGRVMSLFLLTIGLQPIGAFIAGLVAETIGVGVTMATMTGSLIVLALLASRLEIPVLGEIEEPAPAPEDWVVAPHASGVGGSPVVVANTWEINPGDLDRYMEAMRALRRVRLRTGATRWSLFRDADRPSVMTEMFTTPDWDEHIAQHTRIDAEAAAVIRHARSFDVHGEPRTRHMAGLDVRDQHPATIAEQLVDVHAQLHRTDGSVPLVDDPEGPRQPL